MAAQHNQTSIKLQTSSAFIAVDGDLECGKSGPCFTESPIWLVEDCSFFLEAGELEAKYLKTAA
jgi:hypothetical protein